MTERLLSSARWPFLRWFRQWPLSAQVIAALALALFPLGALAGIAATNSYLEVRDSQHGLAERRLRGAGRLVEARFDQEYSVLQTLLLTDVDSADARAACDRQLTQIARVDPMLDSILRVDAAGNLLCASAGARLPQVTLNRLTPGAATGWGRFTRLALIDDGDPARDLVLIARDRASSGLGQSILARVPRASLAQLMPREALRDDQAIRLSRHGETLATWPGRVPPDAELVRRAQDLRSDDMRLDIAAMSSGITVAQVLTIVLPGLMWLAAVLIGWLAIARLVVDPLKTLRATMDRYAGGDTGARVGPGRFATQEISQVGNAFDRMADKIHGHEGDLRDMLQTQTKLTREVHHRVKNNLQIVSSLLSLQSRDAPNREVAYAYATIQKRVNALALVHRWLYDDEAMKGVDLRSLMQDLCAGLEQGSAADGGQIALTPDVERLRVPQDTAVPLAFLVTELATAAARQPSTQAVPVRVSARARDGRGTLTVESPVFRGDDRFAAGSTDPSARIAQGMARQMRTKLEHDAGRGCYAIEFPAM